MALSTIELSIIVPAFIAGLMVTATHVPLGMQVLSRGIVFIDLAIAQIAGVGVMLAASLGFEPEGWLVQIAALSAALLGALLLTWTEKKYPEVQEAIIGVIFVLAATGGVILLAGNVHANENLRDLLVGQILWVRPNHLPFEAMIYAAILFLWFGFRQRIGQIGFYMLFACAVTVSVQLVGLYLVFSTLIIPPLATRHIQRRRLLISYALGATGYAVGLLLSVIFDLPSGPVVVWALALTGMVVHGLSSPKKSSKATLSSQ
ncbi:MAG: metal ABC transporter permease [Pseudomonadota bacterium]